MQYKKNSLLLQFEGFLKTPPLWKDIQLLDIPQYVTKEISVPEKLEREIHIPESLILGKRMEYFLGIYVKCFTDERIILQNQVISRDKITIGEIDFLFENPATKEFTHVELIYKFYLYNPGIKNEIERWIGPNQRDTLIRKLERLQKHQFPLIFSRECRQILQERNCLPEEILQKVCFKASLFLPMAWTETPPLINPSCISGYWIIWDNFDEAKFGDYDFHIPRKNDWPIDPSYCREWISYKEIRLQLQEFLLKKRAPLVWIKKSSEHFERFFVVWW